MRSCRWLASALLALLLFPQWSYAGDFMDTRLTFAIADNNLLAGPGETNPNSPSTGFNAGRRNTLFFDNYNTRFSGFETLSHAVLYKKMPSFFKNLTTAAALVVRMNYAADRSSRAFELTDAGSYIFMDYDLGSSKNIKRNFQVTAFPLSSTRFRLGYSFRISWGGDSTYPRRSVVSPAPGVKFQLNHDFNSKTGIYLFAGAKTVLLQKRIREYDDPNDKENSEFVERIEEETAYGVLGGFGLRVGDFRIEGGGAFFDKGTFSNPNVQGEPVYFYGFSGQMSYSYGMPIGVSIDFRLYKNDPQMPAKFFKPEKYEPGKFSFNVAAEASYLVNLLEDPDTFGGIVPSPGIAADINFRMKYGYFRMHADIVFRDLGFILRDVPGFVPFQAFSEKQKISPEFFAAVGVDYYIKGAHLTIGLKGGVQVPATFQGNIPEEVTGNQGSIPASLKGEQIVMVRDEGDFVLIPLVDQNGNAITVLPIVSAKANFKLQFSEFLSLVGEILFTLDNNDTRLTRDQITGIAFREFTQPIRFGFNMMLQARF
ncbi:MAG: hypothetical protein CL920_10625 [Deltaproteobacteria bacterium]|nr:hypothetical protein [Deltaproteobacteria bacterium]